MILNIPDVIRKIIKSRGIGDEAAEEFFAAKPTLAYDPFLLANMRAGVDLLLQAIDDGKQIVIYGDYDADGVTATALLMKVLGTLTAKVSYYLPSRIDEGYGLHLESIDRIHESGGEFIVTVDCGSVSKVETEYAHSLGIQTLVTDHHNMSEVRAEGLVINPKLPEDEYPFKGLAGVGVAYKLALAISRVREVPRSVMAEVLELVTVGTIADLMPMKDENRTIVKCGLRSIRLGCRNIGLRKLIDMSNLHFGSLRSGDISFGIAPKINAAGRMGDASAGVKLFLAETEEEAEVYCEQLCEANRERRRLQELAYRSALEMEEEETAKGDFVVFEINDSHEGVLGIVAGKLKESLHRPVVIISRNGEMYKGTGRSIQGIDLFRLLDKYRDEFVSFGGHGVACGFTIARDRMEALRLRLNADVARMAEADEELLVKKYDCDAVILPEEATLELAAAAEMLEPCGKENEAPVFALLDVEISNWRYLKNDDKMARFTIEVPAGGLDGVMPVGSDGGGAGGSMSGGVGVAGRNVTCLIFQDAKKAYDEVADAGMRADVFGTVEINEWRDNRSVQIIAKHVVAAGEGSSRMNCKTAKIGV